MLAMHGSPSMVRGSLGEHNGTEASFEPVLSCTTAVLWQTNKATAKGQSELQGT